MPERGLHGLSHVVQLPRYFGCPSAAGRDQLGRLSCEGSSAEGVRSHVCDTGGLASRPCCGFACWRRSALSGTTRYESSSDLACRVQLSAAERSGARDAVPHSIVVRRFLLEQRQNAFGAVRGPSGDDATVAFAQ
jgi:hypothetical protein